MAQLYKLGTWNAGHSNTTAVSQGLVGYWPLDGSTIDWSTNSFKDISGNGVNGSSSVMSTSSSPVLGVVGQALNFNGTNQGINIADANACTNSTCSVSVWVKPTGAAPAAAGFVWNGQEIFGDTNGFWGIYRSVVTGNGSVDRLYAEVWDGGQEYAGITFTIGQWIHLVLVHAGGKLTLYANGTVASSSPAGDVLNGGAGFPLTFGVANGSKYFSGR